MRVAALFVLLLGLWPLGACRAPISSAPVAAKADAPAAPQPRLTRSRSLLPCCPSPRDIDRWPGIPCRKHYVVGSASFMPNVGLGIGGGRVLRQSSVQTLSAEVLGTWQFLDDEAFIDDGNPPAGDFFQVRVGLKSSLAPRARRHVVFRTGAVWFQASGEPNIVDEPGDYYGLYGSVGFETDISPCLTLGPELALMAVTPTSEFSVEPVPQLNWHLTWHPGRATFHGVGAHAPAVRRPPLSEFYGGISAALLPGVGGGFCGGHVFARSRLAVYSFEMLAAFQSGGQTLAFEDGGMWGQLRGGGKMCLLPCCRWHPTARAGLGWIRSTASNEFLSANSDYFGAYVGLGVEYDISRQLSTGPEVSLMMVTRENTDFSLELVPQVHWHVTVKL